jgi:tetratricopeptide (TPR) repeat protein
VCRAGLWLTLAAAGDEAGAEAVLPDRQLPVTREPYGHPGLEAVQAAAWALGERRFAEGLIRRQQRDLNGAVAAFRASLLLAESGEARANLGLALLGLGETEGAARELGRAAAEAPTLPAARFGLGLALEATGRRFEAAEAFRAFLRLDPASPQAAEARARVERLGTATGH